MRKFLLALLTAVCLGTAAPAAPPPSPGFGVAAHDNVSIEWWYVNAHVTTEKGRHLALVGSFFRFGGEHSPVGVLAPIPAHYLIYAVTDLDKKEQRSYSLADGSMVNYLPVLAAMMPRSKEKSDLLAALAHGKLPTPHKDMIGGTATVQNSPFRLLYGYATPEAQNSLTSINTENTAFVLHLGGARKEITSPALAGQDEIRLTLNARKPAMAVGGKGETGLTKPTDMYYYSFTRCVVGGTINTGAGPEKITGGQGWFDHQWGNSWVAQNDGWDWWGVQLDDGTDILFFRQRNLSTGKVFFPLATFMDKDGHQSVTKKIVFTPDKRSLWKSAKTNVTYPLGWTVTFPEKNLTLHITTPVKDQEMPILGPGSGIWEGSCLVKATYPADPSKPYTLPADVRKAIPHDPSPNGVLSGVLALVTTPGVAYMELVGYNSPAVKRQLGK